MRIAFLNRGRETHPGGDIIALDATMEALRKRGHICVETGWHADRIKDFDIAHMFHCNFDWSWGNYQAMAKAGKPYVLTPVFYPGPLLAGISLAQLGEIVTQAEYVLPFSSTERDMMSFRTEFRVIPNGTGIGFCLPTLKTQSVVCVSARGDSDKGIPMLRSICKRIGVPLHIATNVPRAELPTMYRSKVFVNASSSERMSLTIGEALCSGCRVLATQEN